MKDYAKLKELLESQEAFPLLFTFKFIGQGTPVFAESVQGLERAFPRLKAAGRRESDAGKHVALTYTFEAENAEGILEVYRALEKLKDLKVVL